MRTHLVPEGYRDIGARHWLLAESGGYDIVGRALADKHYSRRTVGSPQFMPPGERVVLVTRGMDAVWGWHRPRIEAMDGYDSWRCSIFRNEGPVLSSELVRDAECALLLLGREAAPDGLLTYVWPPKVRSTNPGCCFLKAGWRHAGHSAGKGARRKLVLTKPWGELACDQVRT